MLRISNGKLVTDKICSGRYVYIKNGKIFAVTGEELDFDREIDVQGNYVSPGFIDIHTHGGGGYDFMDGGMDAVLESAKIHFKHGTTSIFPTGLASSSAVIKSFLSDVKQAMARNEDGLPHILGAHLEGPYFNLNQRGAQNPDYIRNPEKSEYGEMVNTYEGVIKRWSFAPELPGAAELCDFLNDKGIISAIAHSEAVYEDVLKVYEKNCKLVTHLYSGMTGVQRINAYRYLGVVESSYLLDDMMVEVIADGHHLPPELLRLIYKIKSADNIVLVTDSMRGAGQPEGESYLGRPDEAVRCVIKGGVALLPDFSSFAGSVATADVLVRTMYKKANISLTDCVKMITETPAKAMGLKNKGQLMAGFDADIVIFDDDINIKYVIKEKTKWNCESVQIQKN